MQKVPLECHQKNCFANCALVSIDRVYHTIIFIVDSLKTKKRRKNTQVEQKK